VVSSTAFYADHTNLILMGISSRMSSSLSAGEVIITGWTVVRCA